MPTPSPLLPVVPAPASVSMKVRQRTKTSQAESGVIYSRTLGESYFEVTLVYPAMTRAQFAPINAFVTARGGKNGIFFVKIPGDMAGATGVLVGNYATFDNDPKLHMITAVSPSLKVTPAPRDSGGNLETDAVYMRCSLARDIQEVKVDNRGLVRFEIDLVERL